MFEQVDGSASRHHDGTGLGLAITRRLLDLMEGKIAVKSEVGEGTEFRMEFVLAAAQDELPALVLEDADLTGLGILIVDDKPVNRQILEEQARSWGMVPESVSGAAAALNMLESIGANRFAAAIVDYQMPGMNGLELAQAIKARAEWADLPLILLTSVGHLGDLDNTISAIFAGVLVKPARTAQLAKKVRAIVVKHNRCDIERVLEQKVPAAPQAEPIASAQSQRSEAVTATLPTPQAAPAPENRDSVVPFRPATEASKPAQPNGAKIIVLVAEDNAVNRKVIEAMLGNGGYALHFAHDGDEAVRAYGNLLPDIVLMDVSMPKLDGYGATAEIRKLEGNLGRRAAVIGLTAHALPEDRQNCLDAGMDEYIPKPVKRETLTEALGRFSKAN
jgi:CheY-like chemotaxis protein